MYVGRISRTSCIRYVRVHGHINMILGCPQDPKPTSGSSRQTQATHRAMPPRSPSHHHHHHHHHHSSPGHCPMCGAKLHYSKIADHSGYIYGPRCQGLCCQSPSHRIRTQSGSEAGKTLRMAPAGISRTSTSDAEETEECVEKYKNHFSWLRDSKFLQQLENDSIDSDIIEEELSALQEEEVTISKRKKVVKLLQSNPVQILLCVVVLLDAVIVIAQILLDLNSVKLKLNLREEQLERFLNLVRIKWPEELDGYEGHNYDHILQILEDHLCDNMTEHDSYLDRGRANSDKMESKHNKDHLAVLASANSTNASSAHVRRDHVTGASAAFYRTGGSRDGEDGMTSQAGGGGFGEGPPAGKNKELHGTNATQTGGKLNRSHDHINNINTDNNNGYMQDELAIQPKYEAYSSSRSSKVYAIDCSHVYHRHGTASDGLPDLGHSDEEEHDVLREVAHGLHFASLAMLGFLVLEDLVKIIAMGSDFFRHKIEIFDAIIITTSFLFDIIFLGGMTGEEGQKAAAVLVILLLWRIARVVDGIMVTVKQRQEFRIRLQKRSRRNAERKIDMLEDERHYRVREIHSLKELCLKAGVKEEEIEACTPRRPHRVSTTMCALSSVARLSVSMTMSMSSGLFSMVDDDVERVGVGVGGGGGGGGDGDGTTKAGRLEHRRYSSNSGKTREYSAADGHDTSPKAGKKRLNPPPSPKMANYAHAQDGIYLPKLDESSLENAADRDPDDWSRDSNRKRSTSSQDAVRARSRSGSACSDSNNKNSPDLVQLTQEDDSRMSGSPENSSGIQIVIDEGSDADSGCSGNEQDDARPEEQQQKQQSDEGSDEGRSDEADGTGRGTDAGGTAGTVAGCSAGTIGNRQLERDSYLTVEAAFDNDRRATASSQIYLLSELR